METALLVTRAGAVAIFAYRFIATIPGFMLARPIIASVTARTIGLERRVLPGDSLSIGLMTGRTLQIASVILWLVGQGRVAIICRRPGVGGMAHVALHCRAEVVRILTGGDRAVVTGRTGSKHLRMINRNYRRE